MFGTFLSKIHTKKTTRELLISTSKSLLIVSIETGAIKEIHTGAGLYYGIAQDKDNGLIYVMARNNADPFNYLTEQERAKENSKIIVFNRALQAVGELYPPHAITDFHQATFHQGKLWITCTILNAIYIYDFNAYEVWYPLEEEGKVGRDINHFNSISIIDNKIHIVAHNHGDSEVLIFNINSRALLHRYQLGKYAHNVWYDNNGRIWVCDSGNQAIVNNQGEQIQLEGFTRGVAKFNGGYFIGSSGLSERHNRKDVDSQIHVLDKKFKLYKSIPIVGFGQVLELRNL